MSYPEQVAFDVRVGCPPGDLPDAVRAFEYLALMWGWSLYFPPGEGLPYEHTLLEDT